MNTSPLRYVISILLVVFLAVLLIKIGAVGVNSIGEFVLAVSNAAIPFLFAGLVSFGVSLLYRFLKGNTELDDLRGTSDKIDRRWALDLRNVFFANFANSRRTLSEGEKELNALIPPLKKWVVSEAKGQLISELREEVKKRYKENWWERSAQSTRLRLQQHIANLERRGLVNLIIGILFALVGVGLLFHLAMDARAVVHSKDSPFDLNHFLATRLPSLSLAIIIEFLAYFFLKLYKVSGMEVRHFVNEMTTHEARFFALEVSREECISMVPDAIRGFISTERNFILSKGETAIPLEKEKQPLDVSEAAAKAIEMLIAAGKLKE